MIYLKNKETNEIIQEFDNVAKWSDSFIEMFDGKYKSKMYCQENEYFTNIGEENDKYTITN